MRGRWQTCSRRQCESGAPRISDRSTSTCCGDPTGAAFDGSTPALCEWTEVDQKIDEFCKLKQQIKDQKSNNKEEKAAEQARLEELERIEAEYEAQVREQERLIAE